MTAPRSRTSVASPPRLAALLLEGLAGEGELGDDVMGDLAEEFAHRAEHDGTGAARRWYRREALRSASHLFAGRVRALRAKDVAHLLGVALSSYVLAFVLVSVTGVALRSLLVAFGASFPGSTSDPSWIGLAIMALVVATMGGYLAAFLEARRPLLAALVFGVSLATLELWLNVGFAVSPAWYGVAVPPLLVAGTIAGALSRMAVASRTRPPAGASR